MAHTRQSMPDSGLGFQVKVFKSVSVVPFSLDLFPFCDSPRQPPLRRRENVAHIRQSRPDSGLGFQVKVRKPC